MVHLYIDMRSQYDDFKSTSICVLFMIIFSLMVV